MAPAVPTCHRSRSGTSPRHQPLLRGSPCPDLEHRRSRRSQSAQRLPEQVWPCPRDKMDTGRAHPSVPRCARQGVLDLRSLTLELSREGGPQSFRCGPMAEGCARDRSHQCYVERSHGIVAIARIFLAIRDREKTRDTPTKAPRLGQVRCQCLTGGDQGPIEGRVGQLERLAGSERGLRQRRAAKTNGGIRPGDGLDRRVDSVPLPLHSVGTRAGAQPWPADHRGQSQRLANAGR